MRDKKREKKTFNRLIKPSTFTIQTAPAFLFSLVLFLLIENYCNTPKLLQSVWPIKVCVLSFLSNGKIRWLHLLMYLGLAWLGLSSTMQRFKLQATQVDRIKN